jgi:hypothetical protein
VLCPRITCTDTQVVNHRAQRVVPDWSPRSYAGPPVTAALFLEAHRDYLNARLSQHADIRAAFPALLTVGDLLTRLQASPGFG